MIQQQQQIADQWTAENISLVPLVQVNDVVNELAKVDEYVRNCAADVASPSPSIASQQQQHISSDSSSGISSAPPSPYASSNASCISSEDSTDDPDWSFEQPTTVTNNINRRTSQSNRAGVRRATKPYSKQNNVEDKRVRKKEQNKNAATRYRQKKKLEIKEILGEENELEEKNKKLKAQFKDLQRETGYLKSLMRDLLKAKGLIN